MMNEAEVYVLNMYIRNCDISQLGPLQSKPKLKVAIKHDKNKAKKEGREK